MRGRRQAYPNLGWGSNRLKGLWIRLDHALNAYFGHLLLNPHLTNKGSRSGQRREATGAR